MILNNGLLSRVQRFADHGDLGGKIAEAVKVVIPLTPKEILASKRRAALAKGRESLARKRQESGK